MGFIAGVDIGNNSTEVAIAEVSADGEANVVTSALVRTVGIKGTLRNVAGIIEALDQALAPIGLDWLSSNVHDPNHLRILFRTTDK